MMISGYLEAIVAINAGWDVPARASSAGPLTRRPGGSAPAASPAPPASARRFAIGLRDVPAQDQLRSVRACPQRKCRRL